jgi:hypothetical protein
VTGNPARGGALVAVFHRHQRPRLRGRNFCGPRNLFFFRRQFKLIKGYCARPELTAAQARKLMPQLLDQHVAAFPLDIPLRQF